MLTKFRKLFEFVTVGSCLRILTGCLILTFGVYNIHALSGVTEGGILGLMLLLDNLFGLSPAWTSLVLNALCYFLGWRTLGKKFLVNSAISAIAYSIFYAILEQFPPVYPPIADMPLLAAVLGAVFVGVGAGICVREESAPSGDDALALSLSKLTGAGIQWVYLISDLSVLTLSLTYIPLTRILYSLLTVVLSGQIIGWVQKIK